MAFLKAVWRKLQSRGSVPLGRSSHSLTVIGQKAHVFSGENTPRVPVDNKLIEYDLASEIWKEIPNKGQPPCPRVAHAGVPVGDRLVIFGGRTGIGMGENSLKDLYCFDTKSGEWHSVDSTGNVPQARSFHAMSAVGDKIYLFGGCVNNDRLNDLHVLDVNSFEWKQLPSYDAIQGRGGPGLAATSDAVYVISGFVGHEVNDMYKFDIKSSKWETLNPTPNFSPRSVFGTAVLGSKICIFGGEVAPSDEGHAGAGQFTNETYCYDTQCPDKGWQKVVTEGEIPAPRGWLQAAPVSDNQLLIFGGNSEANERLNDMYLLQFE